MYQTSNEYKELVYQDSTRHLLKIYIEGQEVNPNHIFDFKVSHILFSNDEFTFGSVTAKSIEFRIHKDSLPETYKNFYVETGIGNEIVPIGHFILDSIGKEDDDTITITAIDYMIKFEFNYDGSTVTFPATMSEVLKDICFKAGVECGSTSFLNNDKTIAVYDNTVSAREYLSYIAEQAGGFACIGRDGKLYIKKIGQDIVGIDIKYFQNFTWGEHFEVSRIAYEDGIRDFKVTSDAITVDFINNLTVEEIDDLFMYRFSDLLYNTIWINSNNMYIVDKDQIEKIHKQYQNFACYSFEGATIVDPAIDVGDLLVINGKLVIYQGEMEYVGKFKANISSKIQPQSREETMTTKISDKTKIRRVQSCIDQINGEISTLVKEVDENSDKISQVIQSVDSWSTKVAEIMDLTDTKSDIKKIEISDGAKSNLIELRIKGNNVVFESKYFDDDVYISEDTYLGGDSKIRVNNVIYELGIEDVLRQKAVTTTDADGKEQIINYYDEYIYSYVDETSQVIRRINPETNYPYVLEGKTERIEELTYFDIPFEEGINVVEIVNYSANFSISYLQKNDYTSYFVSNLQLEGELQVSKDEILGEVSETYTTKDETKQVKSQISQKASSVLIDVTNGETTASIQVALEDENGNVLDSKVGTINMTGIVSFNDLAGEGRTEINGANITTGTISAERLDTSTINSVNGTIGGFKITDVGLQAEGVLIASDGGTIFTNLHTVYEGTEYADLPTTKSYSVDSSATIRHINLIGDGTAMNVAGYTKNFNLYASQSDPQLKKNIKETEVNGLDVINEIEHIEFNWKSNDKFQANGYNAKQLGEICEDFVIAVEQPEGAEYSEILQVRDFNMMPYITKAIQELDKKIKELQEENRILKNMIKGVDENG